ncbi:MAG: prefoldin subunit beta [Candidatus Thermoplasmatota archaeon]|jgi:prefoldin beta subunit|nr:prefoldin subunit beta [Candidatus Thermoplasmatota archaeon]MCL5964145.1 prefoldin subunit beta [Candidatus Thermoplasmatota archaeon]
MIPQKIQKDIIEYQKIEAQLQIILQQKMQLQSKISESEQALDLLKEQPADVVLYKSVGSIMVKGISKESIEKELVEIKETTGMRLKSIETQEAKLKEKYDMFQKNISSALNEMKKTGQEQGKIDLNDEYQ